MILKREQPAPANGTDSGCSLAEKQWANAHRSAEEEKQLIPE
jgi:hypothetical protein